MLRRKPMSEATQLLAQIAVMLLVATVLAFGWAASSPPHAATFTVALRLFAVATLVLAIISWGLVLAEWSTPPAHPPPLLRKVWSAALIIIMVSFGIFTLFWSFGLLR